MHAIYTAAIAIAAAATSVAAAVVGRNPRRKIARFAAGRRGLLGRIEREFRPAEGKPVVWIHAASLGEYQIAAPIARSLKAKLDATVVVTFFSPSGYDALASAPQRHPEADYVYYLPIDTRRNARRLVAALRPVKTIMTVSEFWPNTLHELASRNIDTYLLSAVIRPDSPFFRWYGGMWRDCLKAYKKIFVLDQASADRLRSIGFERVEVSGNTLFDNAVAKARTEWTDSIVSRFAAEGDVIVAGSIHTDDDLTLTAELAARRPGRRILVVPHSTDDSTLRHVLEALPKATLLYSQCTAETDFSGVQCLVVDFVGALAMLYRYGMAAYVGGGFTRYLHSVIEPVVYGLPVTFGPRTERKVTPTQMVELGIGTQVSTPDQLVAWVDSLSPERRAEIARKAREYVDFNAGATDLIINEI